MKYFIGFFIWVLIASGWPIATEQLVAAQDSKPRRADIRIEHDVLAEDRPVQEIFLDVLRGTGLHAGFVEIAGCSDLPKGGLQIKQGVTVGQAMDALVAANPGYQWELRDGVVNLMSQGGAPLLNTRIGKFQMEATDRELSIFFQNLMRLPEVQERETALGLAPGVGQGGPPSGNQIRPAPIAIRIDVQNLTIQDAFNKIVQTSPKGGWFYYETDCNGTKTFTVLATSGY